MKEERIKLEYEKEKDKAVQEMKEEMEQDKSHSRDHKEKLEKELNSVVDLTYELLYYVPRDRRLNAVLNAEESIFKRKLMESSEKYPFVGDMPRNYLRELGYDAMVVGEK